MMISSMAVALLLSHHHPLHHLLDLQKHLEVQIKVTKLRVFHNEINVMFGSVFIVFSIVTFLFDTICSAIKINHLASSW